MGRELNELDRYKQQKDGPGRGSQQLKQLSVALHDLCQPLTTLQCRLELAEDIGTADAYREAVRAGLAECERLMEAVGSMRAALHVTVRD